MHALPWLLWSCRSDTAQQAGCCIVFPGAMCIRHFVNASCCSEGCQNWSCVWALTPVHIQMRISLWYVSRQAAFNVAIAGWIPCGVIFACIAGSLGKEEDALQVRDWHCLSVLSSSSANFKSQTPVRMFQQVQALVDVLLEAMIDCTI